MTISAVSPTFARSVAPTSPQNAVRPVVRHTAPKFGMDPVAIGGVSFALGGILSTFGTAIGLMIKMNYWEKQVAGIKEKYAKLERKEREGFLTALPEKIRGFEHNPSLTWWHAAETRNEKARQAYEAHEELRAQTSAMWTHTTMPAILNFFKETKRETLEHPDAFLHPKVVYAWASYMEALHLVTKAGNNHALTPEQKQDWYRLLDKKWEKTPILKRPELAGSFENISGQLEALIKKHSRSKSTYEMERDYAVMVRELSEDPQLARTVQAVLVEHDDVDFDDLPADPDDLDPTFDEKELERRDKDRTVRNFRNWLDGLSPEDFNQ